MKNSLTNPIFQIPCSKEQAALIVEAFNETNAGWPNYFEELATNPDDKRLQHNPIVEQYLLLRQISGGEWSSWSFDVLVTEDGVDFNANENFDINLAGIFTQAVLQALDLDLQIEIVVVGAGATAVEIAQGTKVCIVTKALVTTRDLQAFFADEREAFSEGDSYYECRITELNGGIEYTSHFLMPCSKEQDPSERLASIFLQYGGNGTLESENYVNYEDGLAGTDPQKRQIAYSDYKIVSDTLTNL